MFARVLPALARVRQLSSQVAGNPSAPSSSGSFNNKGAFAVAGGVGLAMDPDSYTPYKLREIQQLNHNTAIYRFNLPTPDHVLAMPTCSFVFTKMENDGKAVERPYTPIGTDTGYFDLLVKTYKDGVMSSHIASLKPGDHLDVRGPINKYIFDKPNQHTHVGMIAGGTGITPMLQIIHKLLDAKDNTKLTLVFGNLSEPDILLKETLDNLQAKHKDRFNVVYSVNNPPSAWKGEVGVVNKAMLAKYLPKPTDTNIKVFICGPPPMVKAIAGSKAPDYSQGQLDGVLKEMGYSSDQVYKF